MAVSTQTMTDEQRKSATGRDYLDPDYAAKDTSRYPWLDRT
jgi:hypothetical protein